MFHPNLKQEKIVFKSNPPLEPRAVPDYTLNEYGSPVNKYVVQERDNRGLIGLHYDPSVMSLRARINRGVQLQYVDYDVTENDPNKLAYIAKNVAAHIDSNIRARQAAVPEPTPNPEPSNPE